jgi:hypothetical protein
MAEDIFPNRTPWNFTPKSDPTQEYNCVGWSVHSIEYYIWPDERKQFAWPIDMIREESLAAFQTFFERVGFSVCQSDDLEPNIEKIAIYANDSGPQHVARQLPSGKWTSKFSSLLDAEHTRLNVIACRTYGDVVLIMKRRYDGRPPILPELFPPRAKLITIDGAPLVR